MNNNYPIYYSTPPMYRSIPLSPINTTSGIGNSLGGRSLLSRASGLLGGLNGGLGTGVSAVSGVGSKLTFSSLLSGASKTLNVINQAIPVITQVRPIWNNAKTMLRVARAVRSDDNNTNTYTNSETNTNTSYNNETNSINNNEPQFFI